MFNLLLILFFGTTSSFITFPSSKLLSRETKIIPIEYTNYFSSYESDSRDNTESKTIYQNEYSILGKFPRLDKINEKGQLTWYPIGFSKDFGIKQQKITIRDINYIVWKDEKMYYGLRDRCSHQGSSFFLGNTCKNTISCPYHGYIFDGSNGELIQIPKLPHMDSDSHNVECFKVVQKGDVVYFNTIPISSEQDKNQIDENEIFVEPEFYDKEQRVVYLDEVFEHNAKFVSINSLDICHIGFVHTFGNKENPNPLHNSKILKLDDYDHHYKIIYEYMAGKNSLVNKIYNFSNIIVESEYVLPHTTVARVLFGNYSSTIITHALPISKFKTKLFVKAYRSYWSHNLLNSENQNILYPLLNLINILGDMVTNKVMVTTLKEDKEIVDNIDKTSYEGMHGKFSIVYDLFSNSYKNHYKHFYEDGPLSI